MCNTLQSIAEQWYVALIVLSSADDELNSIPQVPVELFNTAFGTLSGGDFSLPSCSIS